MAWLLRDEVAELKDWRGQQEMISDNNSAQVQRLKGDVEALRAKVIRLHTQFELVTKGGPEALERSLAMIAAATNTLPLALEKKQAEDGMQTYHIPVSSCPNSNQCFKNCTQQNLCFPEVTKVCLVCNGINDYFSIT